MKHIPLTPSSRITNYMPLPRSLLELPLSSTAMVLYAILLDRGTLSQKNNFTDGTGWIYVVYPIEDLAELLRISGSTVKNSLRSLESHGLLRRVRRGRQQANQLFLYVPGDSAPDMVTDKNPSGDRQKSDPVTDRKLTPNNRKKQHNLNDCYQHGEDESL